eukprot:567622-Rhodomonas_salina.1
MECPAHSPIVGLASSLPRRGVWRALIVPRDSFSSDVKEQTPESAPHAATVTLQNSGPAAPGRALGVAFLAQTAILDSTEWVVREQTREA